MSKLLRSLAICFLLVEMSAGMAPYVRAADGDSSADAAGPPLRSPVP